MKNVYSLIIAVLLTTSGSLYSQSLHNVDVADFAFTPSALTISVGDTVIWTNSSGFHNVNGTQEEFPDNPDSFGNDIGPAGWSYQYIFTMPGQYNYLCDVHAATMLGSVTVEGDPLSITDATISTEYLAVFPNPVVNQLSWKWNDQSAHANAAMTIYDSNGRRVDTFSLNGISSRDVSSLRTGLYTYVIFQNKNQIQTGKVLIQR